ncbi:hypothetical protein EYV94_04985 [Puteibacter caeruleilacunae]|nr:hypothetical protein EYV94_04985 [Puteibacter caeruleilacunae]
MKQVAQISSKKVHFAKWSRKGWAVFASLGKLITIGHLRVPVCNQSVLKTETTIVEVNHASGYSVEEEMAESDLLDDLIGVILAPFLTLLTTINDESSSFWIIQNYISKIKYSVTSDVLSVNGRYEYSYGLNVYHVITRSYGEYRDA